MISFKKTKSYLLHRAYRFNYKRKLLFIKILQPLLVKKVRNKKEIKVLFVIHSLGSWKTELLLQAMLKHPRFLPMILVTHTSDENSEDEIISYLSKKGYDYSKLGLKEDIYTKFKPDIIFYQKAYDFRWFDNRNIYYFNNLRSLCCYVNYAFHSIDEQWSIDTDMHNAIWQIYYENVISTDSVKEKTRNHAKNIIITGVPQMDEFLKNKVGIPDPWKQLSGNRKRIIWAPHHSIESDGEILHYSTFLEIADEMITLAQKYQDKIQFAFKPHPILKTKLYRMWGKEKTDAYYKVWDTMENCQTETGEYIGLFKHSDAMIHDCGSFQIEYHFTKNPVLYIVNDEDEHLKSLNLFAKTAFNLHYKAKTIKDIEKFICDVIDNSDPLRGAREKFFNESLRLPYGTSACENILNAILGVEK